MTAIPSLQTDPSGPGGAPASLPLHVAVIHAADGVRAVIADPSRAGLSVRLGEYVRTHSAHALWPEAAQRVQRALSAGRRREAIDVYFAEVGRRWDDETLHTSQVSVPLPRS